jgi:predicted DNA-binding WGR domain protein
MMAFSKVTLEKTVFLKLRWTAHTLFGQAVVRVYGRKGGAQQTVTPLPFDSLEEAWPAIRKHIRARLRHGYRIVQPEEYTREE